jgi:hypothetical protein
MNKVLSNDQMLALRYVLSLPDIREALLANEHEKDPLKAAAFWTKVSAEVGESCQVCLHCDLPKHQHLVKKCLFMPNDFEVKPPNPFQDLSNWNNQSTYIPKYGTATGAGSAAGPYTVGITSDKIATSNWIAMTNAMLNPSEQK